MIYSELAGASLVAQTSPETTLPTPAEAGTSASGTVTQEKIQEIVKASQERRWTDVLQMTDMVPETDSAYMGLMNLRLSALVQVKDYDQALEVLNTMVKLDDESVDIQAFNFGEVYFLKKNYKESIKHFERFLSSEGNEMNALARFKLYLGYLLDGQAGKAEAIKSEILPSISHPLYYYVQAASEFKAGNNEVARNWLQSSSNIYSLGLNVAFADTFKEIGWLEPHEVSGFPVLTQAQLKSLNAEFQPPAPNRPVQKEKSFFEGLLPSMGNDKKKK